MTKYTLDNVKEDAEFLKFIKQQQGYESFDNIPQYEQLALLNMFKANKNDLSEEELESLISAENNQELQNISNVYFNGKDIKNFSVEEQVFAQSLAQELQKEDTPALNDIIANRGVTMIEIPSQEEVVELEPRLVTPEIVKTTEERQRQSNSDSNEILIDGLYLETLHEMQLINDEEFDNALNDPITRLETAHKDYNLSSSQQTEFNNILTDKLLEKEQLTPHIPPKLWEQSYQTLQDRIATNTQKNQDYDPTEDKRKLEITEKNIDRLITDIAEEKGNYFNDITNIADTFDGYIQMLNTREKYLLPEQDNQALQTNIQKARNNLAPKIIEYDKEHHLEDITPSDAENLNKRAKTISQNMEDLELTPETLQLVSNFKFLDKDGNIEPQFIDPENQENKTDTWKEGYKVNKEGKLADVIRITKQKILMDNLGAQTEITPETLKQELNETLPYTLFSLHVADKVNSGVLEHPKTFTDKSQRDAFVAELSNSQTPKQITHLGYEAGMDGLINTVGGYANRLASKVGPEKEVVTSLFEPIKDLDKRASVRTTEAKPSKKQVRIEMLKRTAKNGLSAFAISAAITTAGTIAASDASLTAATGGLNKLAGAVVGVGLGAVMTLKTIYRWRKSQKEAGKPAGFKAAIKDARLMATIATTAMGAASLGFAMTGNPGVAQVLGYGALATGVGNGIVTNYKDSRQSGLSKTESIAWSTLQAVATTAAGFGGRAAANAGINYYNQQNPDNNLFQHQEKIGEHTEQRQVGTKTIIDYPSLNENAENFLENNWYKDNPELLQQRIDALTAAGVENPHHMLLAAHDSGMLAPDNMTLYDGNQSQGNHTVLTKAWALENNINFENVTAMKNLFDANGNVNPEAIKSYEIIKSHIAEDNFVTKMTDRPVIRELYGDRESTYDASGKIPTKEVPVYEDVKVDDYGMVRNNTNLGIGMVGIFAKPLKGLKKLKERIGSIADRIFHKREVTPPVYTRETTTKVTPPKRVIDTDKLLIDEYKIVYGVEPNKESQAYKNYCARVEEERQQNNPNQDINDFLIERRKKLDDVIIGDKSNVSQNDVTTSNRPTRVDYMLHASKDDRGKASVVCETRQNLLQSNLTKENYTDHITLSHFTRYMNEYVRKDSPIRSFATRDISLNPQQKNKQQRAESNAAIIDLNQFLLENKSLEESTLKESNNTKNQTPKARDMKDNMAKAQKNNKRTSR